MSMRLLILGLLYQQDMYPYEVLQRLKTMQVEKYMNINYGKLYYTFDRLAQEGLIAVKEVERDTRRPEKTVYTLTSTGRERFRELLLGQFHKCTPIFHPLYPALMFAHLADPVVLEGIVRKRIAMIQESIDGLERLYATYTNVLPAGSLHIMRLGLLHQRAELEWTREFLKDLITGRLQPNELSSEEGGQTFDQ